MVRKKIFSNPASPIVFIESISFNGMPSPQNPPRLNFSAMGFLYRECDDGSYIMVTCAHTFWEEMFPVVPGSQILITKDYNDGDGPDSFLRFELIEGPRFGKNRNEDVAIFKVKPEKEPKHPIVLLQPADHDTLTGNEGSNLVQVNEHGLSMLFSQDSFRKLPFSKYNIRGPQAVLARRGTPQEFFMLARGAVGYPCFSIHSEVGASGSPVWTNNGRLIGINTGGDTYPELWNAVVPCKGIDRVIKEVGY